MTARGMFEELGYKQVRNDSCLIKYEKFINGNCIQITFTLFLKKVIATYGYQTSGSYAHDITSDEFRAIVQQEKELGWLEEEKQETNFDHHKDEIIELYIEDLAISKGRMRQCCEILCSECGFADENGDCIGHRRIIEWLKKPYKKPTYKLSQFEYDLLELYKSKYSFKLSNALRGMKEKGYFRSVDENAKIKDILRNCEVSER